MATIANITSSAINSVTLSVAVAITFAGQGGGRCHANGADFLGLHPLR